MNDGITCSHGYRVGTCRACAPHVCEYSGAAVPSMVVAGYDSNFEDIGSSIRVELPSGGHAIVGKTPLAKCLTDDQLRAECGRRQLWFDAPTLTAACNKATTERDEWKRRAEAADERVASLEARIEGGYLPYIARLMRLHEAGPGIAATKPDNSVAWLDEDLLCEDA